MLVIFGRMGIKFVFFLRLLGKQFFFLLFLFFRRLASQSLFLGLQLQQWLLGMLLLVRRLGIQQ
jgi:hypothetical protein